MNRRARRARIKENKSNARALQKHQKLVKAVEDGTTDIISRKMSASYILYTEILHLTEEMEELHRVSGIGTGKLFNAFKKATTSLEDFFKVFDKEILPGQDKHLVEDFEAFDVFFRKWANIEDREDILTRIRVLITRFTGVSGEDILSRRQVREIADARTLYYLALNKKGFSNEEIAEISGYVPSTIKRILVNAEREMKYANTRVKDMWLEIKKHL